MLVKLEKDIVVQNAISIVEAVEEEVSKYLINTHTEIIFDLIIYYLVTLYAHLLLLPLYIIL